MSYIINKTDGSVLTEVVDGTVDQSATDLTLIGKNASSYGEAFNENFVHLLENFASSSQPNNPIAGQLWFDTTDSRLKVYDGNGFKVSGGTIVQGTPPSTPVDGDLWIDTTRNLLFFRNSGIWVEASRQYTASQGVSGFNITTVLDTLNKSHVVVLMYVAEVIIGVFSKDTFDLLSPLPGYTNATIYAGFNIGTTSGLVFNAPVQVATYLDDGLGNLKGVDSFLRIDIDNTASGTQTIENDIPLILGPGQNNELRVDESRFDIRANNSNQSYHLYVKHNSALKGLAIWNPGLFTLDVTDASGDGSYATLSFAPRDVEPYPVGTVVTVSGITPTGYNGTYTVTESAVDSITFACPETGVFSVPGIISASIEPRIGILTDSPQATLEVNGDTVIQGNLTVFGTSTSINSTVVKVDDKNIELATTDTPTDILADGAGITVKGDTDKTFQWKYSINPGSTHWDSSESLNIASGKTYKIDEIDVLSSTTLGANIVNSSLTSVGHLISLDVANFNIASNTISASSGNIILAPTGSATVDMSNKRITSVATPSLGTDGVNKDFVTSYVRARSLGLVISLNNASGGSLSEPQIVTLLQEVYPAGDYEPGTICVVHGELTTVAYNSIPFTISDTGSPNISISRVSVDKNTTSFVSGSNVSVVQDVVAANAINAGNGTVAVTRTKRVYIVNSSAIWELQPGYPVASSV